MLTLTNTALRTAPELSNSYGNCHSRILLGSDKNPNFCIRVRRFNSCFSSPLYKRRWIYIRGKDDSFFLNKNSLIKRLFWSNERFETAIKKGSLEEAIEKRLHLLSRCQEARSYFTTNFTHISTSEVIDLCEYVESDQNSSKPIYKTIGDKLLVSCPQKGFYSIYTNLLLGQGATKTAYAAQKIFGPYERNAAACIGNDPVGHMSLSAEAKLLRELPPHEGIIETITELPLPRQTCKAFQIASGHLLLQKRYEMTFEKLYTRKLSEEQCISLALELLRGLAYLEKQKICHRDIKPNNLFVEEYHDKLHAVIADFSISIKLADLKEVGGTIGFLSPLSCKYLIGSERTDKDKLTLKMDVWGLGSVLYPLFFNIAYPAPWTNFQGKDTQLYLQVIANLTPEQMSRQWGLEFTKPIKNFKELISWMCHPDHTQRLSAREALAIAESIA